MYQSGRAGDEAKKRKSPAKSGRVGIYGNKLYEITLKKRLLLEPQKTNFKSLKFHKMKSYA